MSQPDAVEGNIYNLTEWLTHLLPRNSEGAVSTIDYVHHAIHDSCHFCVTVYDSDVDIGTPKIVRITTPDTSIRCHLVAYISGDGGFLFEFYENPTLDDAGDALTILNNNRNSVNTATATAFEDTTTQAPNNDGILLEAGYSGGEKKKESGTLGFRDEFILKQDEDYLVKITAESDSTKIIIVLKWYEV